MLSSVVQSQVCLNFLYCPASAGRHGHKGLEWDRSRAADLNWSKGCYILYDITGGKKKFKNCGKIGQVGSSCSETGWESVAGNEQLCGFFCKYIFYTSYLL